MSSCDILFTADDDLQHSRSFPPEQRIKPTAGFRVNLNQAKYEKLPKFTWLIG